MSIAGEARLRRVIQTQARIVAAGQDRQAVMDAVVHEAMVLTGGDGAVVELAEGDEMVYTAATGSAEAHLGLRLSLHGSLSGRCVRNGTALCCDDAAADPRVDADACRAIGIRSMVVVPLTDAGANVGVLKVHSARAGSFHEGDVEVLGMLAPLVTSVLHHASYEDSRSVARRDSLTGLPNRRMLLELLDQALDRRTRDGGVVAVIFVDLDGFKPVNDRLGHAGGDVVLAEVGRRLARAVRSGDVATRIGGDEFVIVAEISGEAAGSAGHVAEAAARIVARVRQLVGEPIVVDGHAVEVGMSVGVATADDPAETPATLLARADAAMYLTKAASRTP